MTITPTPASGVSVSFLDANDMTLDDADTVATGHQVALEDGPNTVKVRVTLGTSTQDYTVVLVRRSQVDSVTVTIRAITGGRRWEFSWDDAGVCAPPTIYTATVWFNSGQVGSTSEAAATENSLVKEIVANLIVFNRVEVWCGPRGTGRKLGQVTSDASTQLDVPYHSPARDATLSALALSPVDVSSFAADTTEYEVDVASSVDTVTITYKTADSNAGVAFFDADDMALADADAMTEGHQVTLAEGENVIKLKVTAPDIRFTETYTLTVNRSIVRAYVDGNNLLVRWKDNASGGCAGDDYKVYSGADAAFTASLQSDEAVTWSNAPWTFRPAGAALRLVSCPLSARSGRRSGAERATARIPASWASPWRPMAMPGCGTWR